MGFYRIALAFAVLISHALYFPTINPGAMAVISFFLLSGYVMTAMIRKHYPSVRSVGFFWIDRLCRLMPQFLFYMCLTSLAVYYFGLRHPWLTATPTLHSALLQFLVVPMNFYWRFPEAIMPQAWSLGLEATFYAVFPFVLIWGWRKPIALASVIVFMLACAHFINTDRFAYRLLPGTLFMFILGSWLFEAELPFSKMFAGGVILSSAALLALLLASGHFNGADVNVLAGLLVGIIAVAVLRHVPQFKADAIAGDLSYGVFLNHNFVLPIVKAGLPAASSFLTVSMAIALSTALSGITFCFVERPVLSWRRRFRKGTLERNALANGLPSRG